MRQFTDLQDFLDETDPQARNGILNPIDYKRGKYKLPHQRGYHSKLRYRGFTACRWADRLGVGRGQIEYHLQRYGNLDRWRELRLSGQDWNEYRSQHAQTFEGRTVKQWMAVLSVGSGTIRTHLARYGNLNHCRPYCRFKGQPFVHGNKGRFKMNKLKHQGGVTQ